MKILLIQVDGKMPNLALMKISAWHKLGGDQVFLNKTCNPDKVYISSIYNWNKSKAIGISLMFPNSEVVLGGSGINYNWLSPKIEHLMPDYDLYGIDYSMGFTSRGCIRNCEFCIVPKKEGYMRNHAPITEFLHPEHEKIILLDNNFLASPECEENLQFILDHNLRVNFNQGLDIRLINEDNAKMLAECKFSDWRFTNRVLHFAFDDPSLEFIIRENVKILKDVGINKTHQLMFYMLVGFNTNFEQDMHRFKVLVELGCDPYVMIYNNRKDIPILRHFARWINKRIYGSPNCRTFGDYTRIQKLIK